MERIKYLCYKLFLDYINNYLTVSKLAEDYNTSEEQIIKMLTIGRHESDLKAKGEIKTC